MAAVETNDATNLKSALDALGDKECGKVLETWMAATASWRSAPGEGLLSLERGLAREGKALASAGACGHTL